MKTWIGRLMSWAKQGRRRRDGLGRSAVARAYLKGRGIEIGALHRPLRAPSHAIVQYVDRLSRMDLYKQYPELAGKKLVQVDIIDDGERLGSIPDNSQDFVIANHFLEHCQDPIGTLLNFLRVLRDGGVLYLAVPDKRYTFDRLRAVTPWTHLAADHEHGPAGSLHAHLDEWARLVLTVSDPDDVAKTVERFRQTGYSIHYHVWTQREFLDFLVQLRALVAFEVELFLKRAYEMIVIFRKGTPSETEMTRDVMATHVSAPS